MRNEAVIPSQPPSRITMKQTEEKGGRHLSTVGLDGEN